MKVIRYIVVVKHPNCNVPYAFRVPETKMLSPGDYVLCNTKKGTDEIARCITPSFHMSDDLIQKYYNVNPIQMKFITGVMRPYMFEEDRAGE